SLATRDFEVVTMGFVVVTMGFVVVTMDESIERSLPSFAQITHGAVSRNLDPKLEALYNEVEHQMKMMRSQISIVGESIEQQKMFCESILAHIALKDPPISVDMNPIESNHAPYHNAVRDAVERRKQIIAEKDKPRSKDERPNKSLWATTDPGTEEGEVPNIDVAGTSTTTSETTKVEAPTKIGSSANLEGLERQLQDLRAAVDKVQETLDDLKRDHIAADQKYAAAEILHEARERRSQQTERDLMETLQRGNAPQMQMAYPQFMPMMPQYGGQFQQRQLSPSDDPSRSSIREIGDNREAKMLRREPLRPGCKFSDHSTTWHTAMVDSGAVQTVTSVDSGYVDICRGPPFALEGISSSVQLDTFAEFSMVMQSNVGLVLARWGNVIIHPQASSNLLSVKQIKACGNRVDFDDHYIELADGVRVP
ncbi:MAG: hypothetical protein AAFY74_20600, partial [Pseudomonadota bacterium]